MDLPPAHKIAYGSAPREPRLRALLGYWRTRHQEGRPPAWWRLDPSEIPEIMSLVMVVHSLGVPPARVVRLAGGGVLARFGADLPGSRLGDAAHGDRLALDKACERVLADERARVLVTDLFPSEALGAADGCLEHLLLPLASEHGVDMVMIGMAETHRQARVETLVSPARPMLIEAVA